MRVSVLNAMRQHMRDVRRHKTFGFDDYARVINLDERRAVDVQRQATFIDEVAHLSEEARAVARMFWEGPAEALGIVGGETMKGVRGLLRRWMFDNGWSQPKVHRVLTELRKVVC